MRIRLNDAWIAGHPDYSDRVWSPTTDNAPLVLDRQIDTKSGPGWASQKFCDARNVSVTVPFTVVREFDTPFLRAAFLADVCSETPSYGVTGTIGYRFEHDHEWTELLSANGVIVLQRVALVGTVSLRLEYEATGGAFVAGDSGTYGELSTEGGDPLETEGGDPIVI